mmetsp:Transcript_32554/g.93745  ORF Transcript_32554/g.93745 Transcript_32554/m.93745 type:complete len:217 (-) Transcript_32554:26-676(-)
MDGLAPALLQQREQAPARALHDDLRGDVQAQSYAHEGDAENRCGQDALAALVRKAARVHQCSDRVGEEAKWRHEERALEGQHEQDQIHQHDGGQELAQNDAVLAYAAAGADFGGDHEHHGVQDSRSNDQDSWLRDNFVRNDTVNDDQATHYQGRHRHFVQPHGDVNDLNQDGDAHVDNLELETFALGHLDELGGQALVRGVPRFVDLGLDILDRIH